MTETPAPTPAPAWQPPRPAYPTPQQRRSSPVGWIVLSLFMGVAVGGTCSTCLTGMGAAGGDEIVWGSSDRVGVIDLFGPIMDATEIVRQIREFAKRGDLKALVIRIDSPGGAVAPSQEIYEALRFASKSKPVVASMGSVAASGGFWSAMGADWVFASPGSVTGSIGVITQTPDLRGLAELLRVNMRTFKSGPVKDLGNPLREMTEADVNVFMSLINDVYDQFVQVVAERRKMDVDAVKKLADGRILTGRAALEAGLIDQLGGLHDAARKAVELADARKAKEEGTETATAVSDEDEEEKEKEDPTLIYPKKPMPSLLRMLTEGAQGAVSSGIAEGVERAADSAERRFAPNATSLELR